jgi:hypothetical protein
MEKFEILTSVINSVENSKENAMQVAQRMSVRYGRASVFNGYTKIAVFKNGTKVFEKK